MNRTKIEWCDFTINPVKGLCPVGCEYCYARRMYKRFGWNPEIRPHLTDYPIPELLKTPSRIFVGSTIELFGDWVKPEWMDYILAIVRLYHQHTFIFLTKRPWELAKWSWPDNAWVGATATDFTSTARALYASGGLERTQAKVKFISFEPLLGKTEIDPRDFEWAGISWVIIGQQTPPSPRTAPRKEWIQNIIEAADKARTPIFLKNNLRPILGDNLRQEWPK